MAELPDRTSTAGPADDCPPRSSPSRCSTTSPRTTRASGGCCSTCCRSSTRTGSSRTRPTSASRWSSCSPTRATSSRYFQDAVANEAYLDTARHAHLGAAARAARRLPRCTTAATRGPPCTSRRRTRAGARTAGTRAGRRASSRRCRTTTRAAGRRRRPPTRITARRAARRDPALARGGRVRDGARRRRCDPRNNEIRLHTLGQRGVLPAPRARREAYLYATRRRRDDRRAAGARRAATYLLLEEVLGPRDRARRRRRPGPPPGRAADRGRADATDDPLYARHAARRRAAASATGDRRRCRSCACAGAARTRSRFPLCLSRARRRARARCATSRSRAGNIVLADHGLTTSRGSIDARRRRAGDAPFRLRLDRGPLTMQCQPDGRTTTHRPPRRRGGPGRDVRRSPAVALPATPTGPQLDGRCPTCSTARRSTPHFVAEVDDDGRAVLRFGDGEYGRALARRDRAHGASTASATAAPATSAPSALAHARRPSAAPTGWHRRACATRCRRAAAPTPRRSRRCASCAPQAFRAEQFRAVTEADYGGRAASCPSVAGRGRDFRWTGSWYTVFVGVDPRDPADLITGPGGRTRLRARLRAPRRARSSTRYRLAGYDLEIRSAALRPARARDRGLRRAGLLPRRRRRRRWRDALSTRRLPRRPARLLPPRQLHVRPARLPQPHLRGGRGGRRRRLGRRHACSAATGSATAGELERGVLPIGPWEIARLDNDPNFIEHGVLTHRRAGRQGMSDAPAAAASRARRRRRCRSRTARRCRAIAYRIGTFASFREAMLEAHRRARRSSAGAHDARAATTTRSPCSSCGRPSPTC